MRESQLSRALRIYNSSVWGVIMGSDDSHAMQTITARGLNNELFTGIQRPQVYGLNTIPVNPDENGGSAAEVVIGFRDGNRAHPYVVSEGDRRTRPKNGEPGQSGLWHYQGAGLKFTQSGFAHDAGLNKKPSTFTVGDAVVTIADGKITCQVGGSRGPALVVKRDAVYAGGDPDAVGAASFYPVQTTGGPSNSMKALVG